MPSLQPLCPSIGLCSCNSSVLDRISLAFKPVTELRSPISLSFFGKNQSERPSCASRPSAGRTECTRGPSGHGAHGLPTKTRHCAMPTPHKPSDFAARHSRGRNIGHLQLPAVAPEAASARPIPAHATRNPGALVWPSSKQEAGRLYLFLPSFSQAIGRHIKFFVSS